MFWGLIMEPNKRYSQTVEKAFHVSMATLDVATADDEIVQVMLCYDNRNYLLCNLKSGSHWQMPLDLNFKEGTKIAFTSNGRGHVHLTGYLLPEEDLDDFDEMEDEDVDDEELEEEEEDEDIPQLVGKQGKRKAQTSPNDGQLSKRLKALASAMAKGEESSSDDDDEDDDSGAEAEDASMEIQDGDESKEDDDDDDDDEEEEDEEEEEEESEDEEEVNNSKTQQKKKKLNQSEQKQLQKQQAQQKQKNQKSQKLQNSLTNGKDAKVKQVNKVEPQTQLQSNAQVQKKKVIAGGVQIEDIKVGNGAVAKQGKFVSVYYIGRLKNGKKFDATTNGEGFKFRLGKGEVIKGWDVGVQGMKIGGKRRITIPPAMAYGAKGSPPVIPGNSTLTFEVELKNVH